MRTALLTALIVILPAAATAAPPMVPPGKIEHFYICQDWIPEEPRGRWIVLDFCFCAYDGSAPYVEPTQSQRDAIRDAGGRILYEFHIPCLRARVPVAAVPPLVQDHCWTEPVPHIREYPVQLLIKIPLPLSAEDRAFLLSLGARDIHEFNRISWISAIVPDASIPALREHPSVEVVEPNFKGCPLLGPRVGLGPHGREASPHRDALGPSTWGRVKSTYR